MNKKIIILITVLILLSSFASAFPIDAKLFYNALDNETGSYTTGDTYPPYVSFKDWGTLLSNGVVKDGTNIASDVTSGYFDFDGTNDRINTGANFDYSALTLGFWGNLNADSTGQNLVVSNPLNGWGLTIKSDNTLSFSKIGVSEVVFSYTLASGWNHYFVTYDGSNVRLYEDNVLKDTKAYSVTFTGGGDYFIGVRDGRTEYLNSDLTGVVVYDRVLSDSERQEWVDAGRGNNPLIIEFPIRKESAFQVTQEDLVTITTDDLWTTIIQGQISLEENHTNYGSTTIQTLSNTVDTDFECRTLVDGNETGDNTARTNLAGQVGSMTLLRPDIETAGIYDLEVQCKKNGGTTFINFTNGIGHVFNTSEVISFDFNSSYFVNGTNQIVGSQIINSTYNGAIVFESSATATSTTASSLLELRFITDDGQSCGVNRRYIDVNKNASIGGICSIDVSAGVPVNISIIGNGTEVNVNGLSHAKILTNANSTPLYSINVTDSQTLIGQVEVNNTQRLDKVFMKSVIPVEDSNQTINLQFAVDGVLVGQVIPYTAGTETRQSIQQYLVDAPDKDYFNVSIYATADAVPVTDIEINGGEIGAYVVDSYNVNSTYVLVKAFNDWNGTQLQEFSVFDGATNFTTIDGEVNIFTTAPELNLTLYSDTYLSRAYLNHNTSNDINGSLYQSVVTINATTLYANRSISTFNITTEENTYTTNNGTLFIRPNIGDYLWNFTGLGYYSKENIAFNVSSQYQNFTVENISDVYTIFRDAKSLDPLTNGTVTLKYDDGFTKVLQTNEAGSVLFAGKRVGSNSTYNLTFEDRQGYVTPITFSEDINTLPYNTTYDIDRTNITLSFYDRETGEVLLQNVTFSIEGVLTNYTTTGVFSLDGVTITQGVYNLYASSDGYSVAYESFEYTGQQDVDITIYLVNATSDNIITLITRVYDLGYNLLKDADVRLQEYNPTTKSFIEVSRCFSDSNGECIFEVEKGIKIYKTVAFANISGTVYTEESSEVGSTILLDQTTYDLYLGAGSIFDVSDLYDLTAYIDNKELNGNLSTATGVFVDTAGISHKVCLAYYYWENFQKKLWFDPICEVASSGSLSVSGGYLLDRDFTNIIDLYINDSGNIVVYDTVTYDSVNSLSEMIGAMLKPIFIFIMAGIVALSLYLRNLGVFSFGMIALIMFSLYFTPTLVGVSIASGCVVECLLILYLASKESGNSVS